MLNVFVAGVARNHLLPSKLAYYVPKFMGKSILPEGWQPKLSAKELGVEYITPAFFPQDLRLASDPQTVNDPSSSQGSQRIHESFLDSQTKASLVKLGSIAFQRVRIDRDSDRIFGSITADDISIVLKQSSIHVDSRRIVMALPKLKTLGTHSVQVTFESAIEPVELTISITETSKQ